MSPCTAVGFSMRALAAISTLVVAGSVACSAPEPGVSRASAELSGGQLAPPGSWPMVGWLDNGCSAVLVSPELALSAAHCGAATTLWLGDAFQITVDDRAGTARAVDAPIGSEHRILGCVPHPNAQLASGRDIEWCRLSEPALQASWIAPVLLGCNRAALREEQELTLVGFGGDETSESVGLKRTAVAPVVTLGLEIEVGDARRGACAGDSGGPAFAQLDTGPGSEWQLAGLLSSGLANERCGVGYYTDVSSTLAWIEASSGVDLSPCGSSDGAWSPSAACQRAALDREGRPISDPPVPSTTCGAAYALAPKPAGCTVRSGASVDPMPYLACLSCAVALLLARRRRQSQTAAHAATAQRM
ncbi:MAG TPA: trypsin-like serine protease [Polyangiaceae bacterium]|nr:trypsin-like serine protease [Polyangiaceae bacterium]